MRAAAELTEALERLNEEIERDWGVRIEARTGVNSGEVVAGDPAGGAGTRDRRRRQCGCTARAGSSAPGDPRSGTRPDCRSAMRSSSRRSLP